ncbi:peroxidase 27-like [Quercus suber]|uniref:peroxidase 27-like n=1 Tax=Quercus suber TaxID=58331 RepID=UPI000CE16BB2|nr:peroxidase 27-like [Quercus suber]
MATSNIFTSFFFCFVFVFFVLDTANAQGLKVGFYAKTCPEAEIIVKKVIAQTISEAPSLAGPLLRMHFHDCFVRGCEGSVLLNSSTKQAEKYAIPNLSLRGFQIIDKVKSALEKACPGVVSCADIVALVARDVVAASMGPSWEVETGRRDGRISNLTEALLNLIPPFANITTLKNDFLQKGLSVKDLVVLSGGHTIGTSHCSSFTNRLYNFTGKGIVGDADPTLDPNYVLRLKNRCKPNDVNTLVEMDPGSFKTFDDDYYTLVTKRRGLFQSDSALLNDPETKAYVKLQASTQGSTFFKDFGVSMVNMGRIGVLTGNAGEIRKQCSRVN